MSQVPFFRRPFKYRNDNLVLLLVALNLIVFLICRIWPGLVSELGMIPVKIIATHSYWQFFTYMFVHGSLSHLLFNMLSLFLIGIMLERELGSKEFLLFYVLIGVLSSLTAFAVYYFSGILFVNFVGASGAIYGLMFLIAVLFPRTYFYVFGLIPVPAPVLIVIYTVIEIYSELTGDNSGVAHIIHLSGFVFAWLYCRIRFNISPVKRWRGLQ